MIKWTTIRNINVFTQKLDAFKISVIIKCLEITLLDIWNHSNVKYYFKMNTVFSIYTLNCPIVHLNTSNIKKLLITLKWLIVLTYYQFKKLSKRNLICFRPNWEINLKIKMTCNLLQLYKNGKKVWWMKIVKLTNRNLKIKKLNWGKNCLNQRQNCNHKGQTDPNLINRKILWRIDQNRMIKRKKIKNTFKNHKHKD